MKTTAKLITFILILAPLLSPLAYATGTESPPAAIDLSELATLTQASCKASGGPCELKLEAAAYSITKPIDVCLPLRIVGKGVGFTNSGTTILTRRTTAIRTWHRGYCPNTALNGNSGSLVLENVTLINSNILGMGLTIPDEPPFFGIEQKTRVALTNVAIRGFVQGIRVQCGVPASNCNGSTYTNVDIETSEHAGFYANGSDANAMVINRMRADGSCRAATKWNASLNASFCAKYPNHLACTNEWYKCAGIFDASFLGNTYTGTANAFENNHAGMVVVGGNNCTTVIGSYLELDSQPGYIDARVNVIGGHSTFAGPGGQWHGAKTTGLTVEGNGATLRIGSESNTPNTLFQFSNTATGPWPWRLKLNPTNGDIYMDTGNIGPVRWGVPYKVGATQ